MPIAKKGTVYNTQAWRRFAEAIKRRDRYRCRTCGAPGTRIGGDATLSVQHVEPVREALHRQLDPVNCKTLCLHCHGKEDGGRRYG
jgi:5-methylcytosine-specific restriction protein A